MSESENKPAFKPDILFWIFSLCLIGILLFVFLPNFNPRTFTATANACINNLRQIDAAANQFALEQGKTNGQAISFPNDLTPYIKLNRAGKIPPCPSGGVYHMSKIGENPTCTLSTATPVHALPNRP